MKLFKNIFNTKELRKKEHFLNYEITISEDTINTLIDVAVVLKDVYDCIRLEEIQTSWNFVQQTLKENAEIINKKPHFSSYTDNLTDCSLYQNDYDKYIIESVIEGEKYQNGFHKTSYQYLSELEKEYERSFDYEILEKICAVRLEIVERLKKVYEQKSRKLQKNLRVIRLRLVLVCYVENIRETIRKKINYFYKRLDDEHEIVLTY